MDKGNYILCYRLTLADKHYFTHISPVIVNLSLTRLEQTFWVRYCSLSCHVKRTRIISSRGLSIHIDVSYKTDITCTLELLIGFDE